MFSQERFVQYDYYIINITMTGKTVDPVACDSDVMTEHDIKVVTDQWVDGLSGCEALFFSERKVKTNIYFLCVSARARASRYITYFTRTPRVLATRHIERRLMC